MLTRARVGLAGMLALLIAPTMIGAEPRPEAALAQEARPNILVIVTDDQRARTLSTMPATRRLFRRGGTAFRWGFATTPTCCPSRASIFTGKYVHNHGVRWHDQPLADHTSTMQYQLQQAGYQTAIAGKFLNSWNPAENPPYFDRWALTKGAYYDYTANVNGYLYRESRYHTNFIRRKATRFLSAFEAEDDERPWMLYLAPIGPHGLPIPAPKHRDYPITAWKPPPSVEEEDRSDKPTWVQESRKTARQGRFTRREQLRTLVSVDQMVARVFAQLEATGEADNTLAIFLSDNGLMWGEHWLANKGVPYTEAINVPFLARWPGRIAAGGRDSRFVANIDIAPTVLEAAGVTPAQTMDGRSILQPEARDRILLEHWFKRPDWASIRTSSYQYVEYYAADSTTVVYREYYDLVSDPWQLTNLLGDVDVLNDPAPARIAQLSAQLALDRRCEGDECP